MVELAVADHPAFRAIDIELKRGGPSYTYDTMRSLVEMYPDCQFSFIIGGDMVKTLRQWYRIDDLVKMVRFIGLSRPGAELIESEYRDFVTLVEMPKVGFVFDTDPGKSSPGQEHSLPRTPGCRALYKGVRTI